MNRLLLAGLISGTLALGFSAPAVASSAHSAQWSSTPITSIKASSRDDKIVRSNQRRHVRSDSRRRHPPGHYRRDWAHGQRHYQPKRKHYRPPPRRTVTHIHIHHVGPGWYRHAYVGQRLPHDLYRHHYHLPRHGRVHRVQSGVTELIIADQVIRILDATQTIINVSRR